MPGIFSIRLLQAGGSIFTEHSRLYTRVTVELKEMVGGELKVFFRGASSALAAVRGARSEMNIPDADKRAVENVIKRIYAKFDRPFPDKASNEADVDPDADILVGDSPEATEVQP